MKKLTITVVVAMLCLNFRGIAQTNLSYKYGISGYKYGYPASYRISKRSNPNKSIIVRNCSVLQLFEISLSDGNPGKYNKMIINVANPEKLQELHCYQLNVPGNKANDLYIIMYQNLKYEFPDYEVNMEKRDNEYCMVIRDSSY